MSAALIARIYDRLDPVSPEQWRALFPTHPDSPEMLRLIQSTAPKGFRFHSIVIWQYNEPVLLLPMFDTVFALEELVEGAVARWGTQFAKRFPSILHPRLLGIGFPEGEWGAAGTKQGASPDLLSAAWRLAMRTAEKLAKQVSASILLFPNWTAESCAALPISVGRTFAPIDTYPYAKLPIRFTDLEGYLATLSKVMRKNIRRKLRQATEVEVISTQDVWPWLDAVYELYLKNVERSDLSFGALDKSYFADICRDVPGARFMLYRHQEKLVAFNLVIVTGGKSEMLVDKYFGMDRAAGRDLNLWFVSWIENIKFCLKSGVREYLAGSAAEESKAHLGAEIVAGVTLFRHTNPLLHSALNFLRPLLAYKPEVPIEPVRLNRSAGLVHKTILRERKIANAGPMALFPILLDVDGSIRRQPQTIARLAAIAMSPAEGESLRLFCGRERMAEFRSQLKKLRSRHAGRWFTFLGSGDFHHLSLALIETLPESSRPFSVVLIDRHPDWGNPPPRYHCGNWVSGVFRISGLQTVTMIGVGGGDIEGLKTITAPFKELCSGRLTLYPEQKDRILAPMRWAFGATGMLPKHRRTIFGTELTCETIRNSGATAIFQSVAEKLAGQNIYLSIDKDCLSPAYASTDWDQGSMTLPELVSGIKLLAARCKIIGADTCGDRAPQELQGTLKRLDAGKRAMLSTAEADAADALNESANLQILAALGVGNSKGDEAKEAR